MAKHLATAEMNMENFCGLTINTDIYNGVHVDLEDNVTSKAENKQPSIDEFDATLKDSLLRWIDNGKRCVWFRVPISQTHFIPILTKHDFQFHHAKPNYAMLFKWIKQDEEIRAPKYAHTMVGVGGLVYNPTTQKVLLVQEKTSIVKIWKFPGGYAEAGEDIFDTSIREVKEETGLKCKFHSLLTFRHRKRGAFDCSDLYFVCLLIPEDEATENTLKKCDIEIEECRWFSLEDAYRCLGGFNKFVFERFLNQYENLPFSVTKQTATQGYTINSEMIHSQYAHLTLEERVYSLGPINPFN